MTNSSFSFFWVMKDQVQIIVPVLPDITEQSPALPAEK